MLRYTWQTFPAILIEPSPASQAQDLHRPPTPSPLRVAAVVAYPGWPMGVPLHFSEDQISGLEIVWHPLIPLCSS